MVPEEGEGERKFVAPEASWPSPAFIPQVLALGTGMGVGSSAIPAEPSLGPAGVP